MNKHMMLSKHMMRRALCSRRFLCAVIASLVALCIGGLAGCSGSDTDARTGESPEAEQTGQTVADAQEPVELQLFAANSLEMAMPKVQALYTAAHPEVTFTDSQFKASGDLVEEIQAGAHADILITASKATMDDAEAFIIPESRTTMFGNDLVVCAAEESDITIDDLTDLKKKNIGRIAIGDAELVPAGKYANQSLYSADYSQPLYTNAEGEGGAYDESISDKIALANQVGTCAQWVASGNCDIGFIYTSDLFRYEGIKNIYTVPEEMHKIITYPGAVLNDSEYQEVAEDFLFFCMTDPDALTIWQESGFELK